MSEWLTVPEAADYSDFAASTLYTWISEGKLEAEEIDGVKKISKSELDSIEIKNNTTEKKKKSDIILGKKMKKSDSVLQERMKRLREMGEARKGPMVDMIVNALIRNKEAEQSG